MRQNIIDRLNERRWLVDELRLVTPPQHFMTQETLLSQYQCTGLLLDEAPNNPLHVYVHIPFCEERCTFCKYFDRGAKEGSEPVQQYVDDLVGVLQHFQERLGERRIHALYVGGGTASILTNEQIRQLFSGAAARFHQDAEATFEMSPRSSNAEKLEIIRDLGFNRVSFGLQTFSERLLRSMHRKPASVQQMSELLECTRKLGFHETNVDLMVGVENESSDDLYSSAEALLALRPPSVSVYREARPRFGRADLSDGLENFIRNVVQPRILKTAELARSSGYDVPADLSLEQVRFRDKCWTKRAVPEECRYRTRYDPYVETTLIGIGPGAFSFCGGKLYSTNPSLQNQKFAQRELSLVYFATTTELGAAIAANKLYMGSAGVEHEMFRKAVGITLDDLFGEELRFLEEQKLVQKTLKGFHRTCDDAYRWAYSDKILYPEQWIRHTRMHGQDR